MTVALVRVSLFVVATSLQTLSVAPPNPIPDKAHQKRFRELSTSPDSSHHGTGQASGPADGRVKQEKRDLWLRLGSFYFPYAFIVFLWVLVILEVPRSFAHNDPLNFRFISGTSVAALASVLRFASFRALGHHFTYQLAILPSHKLVTTGPYAYVRHPSYIALPLIVLGWASSFTSQGTVLREWIGESKVDGLVLSVLIGLLYVGWQFVKRAEVEDQVLREKFGKEWEEWAAVVKYRFIPGLY